MTAKYDSEVIVDSGAHDIGGQVRIRAGDRGAAAEIDIEIFELGTPRPIEVVFEAAAGAPASLGLAGATERRDRVLDVAEGAAAGDITLPH
jgi:hypothetical protein